MDECIFCQIAAGDIPSYTVYEGDGVIAFLDVNPLAAGHTLVVPTEHRARLQELSDTESQRLWDAVQALVPAVEEAVDADATTVGVNNGPAAGQEVPHVHVHLVPRSEGDGGGPIHAIGGPTPDMDEAELATIGEAISDLV